MGIGATVEDLTIGDIPVVVKQAFDVCREVGFLEKVLQGGDIVMAGCEAHVCVLQTVLGLIAANRKVYVVRAAIGSRAPANKEAAILRMARPGTEIVTTELGRAPCRDRVCRDVSI